jgi:hypothetical protein
VTNEGRYLTVLESDLTHPVHSDGFADKGDPVNIGNIVGVVCSESPTAATDLVTVDTEGLYYLNVVASDGNGTSNVAVGEDLYIATGVVSKIATGIPFGKALTALTGSASAAVCLVKVHMPIPEGTMVGTNFTISVPIAAADITANKLIFVAPAACKVLKAYEAHTTVAGQAGTLQLEKCNTGEAATAGDNFMASAWDLTSTANTPVEKDSTLDAKASLVAGDMIRLNKASGAATSYADGVVTLLMQWL